MIIISAQEEEEDTPIINIQEIDSKTAAATLDQLQNYYLHSIKSTVVIRHLPSQGISFQLWPAATTLVSLIDKHRSSTAPTPFSALLNRHSQPARPLRILELGSGTGVVGIAAAAILGANVTPISRTCFRTSNSTRKQTQMYWRSMGDRLMCRRLGGERERRWKQLDLGEMVMSMMW